MSVVYLLLLQASVALDGQNSGAGATLDRSEDVGLPKIVHEISSAKSIAESYVRDLKKTFPRESDLGPQKSLYTKAHKY